MCKLLEEDWHLNKLSETPLIAIKNRRILEPPSHIDSIRLQFLELMAPSEVLADNLSDWYTALFEEDCVQVMKLLKDRPSLLKEGWESSERWVRGSPLNFWMGVTRSQWKGRTALHVGARRGCVELVEQVIKICEEGITNIPKEQQRVRNLDKSNSSSSKNSQPIAMSPEHSYHVQIEGEDRSDAKTIVGSSSSCDDGRREDIVTCSYSQDDMVVASDANPHEAVELAQVAPNSSLATEDPGRTSEMAPLAWANLKSEIDEKRSKMVAELAVALWKSEDEATANNRTDSRAFGDWKIKLAKKDRVVDNPRDQGWSSADIWVSLKDLLRLKDGEYKLDALAMAYLNGNLDVLSLLITAYAIIFPGKRLLYEADHGLHTRIIAAAYQRVRSEYVRAQLRTTTEGLIGRIRADPITEARYRDVFKAYSKHRDFNFLPRGEYLFHFLFTTYFSSTLDADCVIKAEVLQESLWSEVLCESSLEGISRRSDVSQDSSSKEDSLWQFQLELQDGQGRTPLHVAVDEGTVDYFARLLRWKDQLKGEPMSQANVCALTARDASGRTAIHRAIAVGNLDAIRAIPSIVTGPRRDTYIQGLGGKQIWLPSSEQVEEKGGTVWLKTSGKKINIGGEMVLQSSRNDVVHSMWTRGIYAYKDVNVDAVSVSNGFKGRRLVHGEFFENTPLHSALVHKRMPNLGWTRNHHHLELLFDPAPFTCNSGGVHPCAFTTLELAILVGDSSLVKSVIEDDLSIERWVFKENIGFQIVHTRLESEGWTWKGGYFQKGDANKNVSSKRGFALIHLAASLAVSHGNYELLKEMISRPDLSGDPYVEDYKGNTALHYAMQMGAVKFEAHLLDYVNCEHLKSNDPRNTNERVSENNNLLIQRQGCINLLLQSGCDIFKANKEKQTPYPSGDLSADAKFLSWWYNIQSKEFTEIQNTMSFAANAISVTATLVATASYVGPLQPPLGYGGDNQMQKKNIWVRIFIVCDTLSFYLAIAAIIFSLIPSLPMPQQRMMDELRRKRIMVTLATAILFPSIICILVAFASSSIAVTTAHGASSNGGILTIITSSIGGLVCFLGFILFSIRLLDYILPGNTVVRKLYHATSF